MTTMPQEVPGSELPKLTVIGIGTSVGALPALRSFLGAFPAHTGLTFVVIAQLAAEQLTMLVEQLQPAVAMPIVQVTARVQMQPDHVYVIPPAKPLLVTDSSLDLAEFREASGVPVRITPIDTSFRSLAEHHGDGAVVILSGSGSDGAVGMQAFKEKGGLLLVQSPDEATDDTMPRSAIATGMADVIAPVAELAATIVAANQVRARLQLPAAGEALSTTAQQPLRQILTQLHIRTGHDFSSYQQDALLRRIARRMQLTQLTTLPAYQYRLRHDKTEADALVRDLLLKVTAFFRDREEWTTLETTIIPRLFAGKGRHETLRVWIVGCATGEEAYTLAMLLLEYAATLVAPPTIQIFASDSSQAALAFAREGCYPEAIAADLTEARLLRFFTKENSHYRVHPELQEAILFTQHDLLQDPPFSRLDLLVCRKLMRYLQRERQEKLFHTFYYALHPGGYLFLGNTESAERVTNLFATIDKDHRLYQRHLHNRVQPMLSLLRDAERIQEGTAPMSMTTMDPLFPQPSEEHQRLLAAGLPPSILVDRTYRVLHLSETAGRFLLSPGGTPTIDLLKLARPELQAELRSTLLRAFEENKVISTRPLPVQFDGAPHLVYLVVRPFRHPVDSSQTRALVFFLEDETMLSLAPTVPENPELRQVQLQLQSIREEYETTLEELRAATVELQSANEEYQSSLEALETSKEELQSINEELQTVNQELKSKIEEVSTAHSDVQNLFVATDIATLFLDRELRIKRYTPNIAELFHLTPPDKGRPLVHLRSSLLYPQLVADAQQVLAYLIPVEREVQSQDAHWFLVRLRPYRTIEDKIDGVVITFVDITTNKANEQALRDAKVYAESIVHTIPDALLVLDAELRVRTANDAFYAIFQLNPAAAEGQLIYAIDGGHWNIPALQTLLEEILPAAHIFNGYEVDHTFARIGRRTMLINGRQLEEGQLILLSVTDITQRKRAEEALQQLNATLEQQVETRTAQVQVLASTLTMAEQEERRRISQILHDDLQQQLYGIQMRLMTILTSLPANRDATLAEYTQEAYTWVGDAIRLTRQLTVDLSPPVLKHEGLAEALQWIVPHMAVMNGLQVELHIRQVCPVSDENMRVLLFQSVRELLFNVVKHAGTNHAVVELDTGDAGECVLIIQDEGRGFDVATTANNGTGFGLFSVRERLKLFGGQMDIQSAPGQGTRITLYAPVALQSTTTEDK